MGPFQATVADSIFFKYTIEDKSDLENLLLLLNISKKKDLEIYVHSQAYPTSEFNEHGYALGDVPEFVIRSIFKNYYMREMYHDANPFQYVRALDQVLYYPHFRNINPDCFVPENREKLDSHRMAKFTTWSPERGPDLAFVTPYNLAGEPEDRMDLCINAAMWQFRKPEVYIGVYNRHPEKQPVAFDIRVREMTTQSCLPEDLRKKDEVFNVVHEGTDAHLTSD
mmetsp:Transcript_36906/g.48500  ORF Transcript_36906/g.48500 Transcript_36906/m.48500 type:complete len:224 (+) Transcript_36906:560-1231(+)